MTLLPGAFAYRNAESDSASSLASLADADIDKVAEFVVPDRTPERIPHKAIGAYSLLDNTRVSVFNLARTCVCRARGAARIAESLTRHLPTRPCGVA